MKEEGKKSRLSFEENDEKQTMRIKKKCFTKRLEDFQFYCFVGGFLGGLIGIFISMIPGSLIEDNRTQKIAIAITFALCMSAGAIVITILWDKRVMDKKACTLSFDNDKYYFASENKHIKGSEGKKSNLYVRVNHTGHNKITLRRHKGDDLYSSDYFIGEDRTAIVKFFKDNKVNYKDDPAKNSDFYTYS